MASRSAWLSTSSMSAKPPGAQRSTSSITPSGPPLRLLRTISAVFGSRSSAFSWHALLPPGTFVPPHIHTNQDEFIYVLEGKFDLILDGKEQTATAGDFIRLPMKIMHGLFNKSDQPIKCLFWVSPTGKLFDLFKKIDGVPDPAEVTRLAALHDVNFLPPPPGKK
jgi:uncharacterized RmlC-like cupin family protein